MRTGTAASADPSLIIYVNGVVVRDLSAPVSPQDEDHIIAALSGG